MQEPTKRAREKGKEKENVTKQAKTEQLSPLENLPNNTLLEILRKLTLKGILNLDSTSTKLHAAISSSEFWKEEMKKDLNCSKKEFNSILEKNEFIPSKISFFTRKKFNPNSDQKAVLENKKFSKESIDKIHFLNNPWFNTASHVKALENLMSEIPMPGDNRFTIESALEVLKKCNGAQVYGLSLGLRWKEEVSQLKNTAQMKIMHELAKVKNLSIIDVASIKGCDWLEEYHLIPLEMLIDRNPNSSIANILVELEEMGETKCRRMANGENIKRKP